MGNDFVAISAGGAHSLALKADGSVVGWGRDDYGQTTPPEGNDFVAVSAGWEHSLALKANGSVAAWGRNDNGQVTPPEGNDYVAVSAGVRHSIALRADGRIAEWGGSGPVQPVPPEGNDFVAISAGGYHSLALKADGSIVGWGNNHYGCATPPEGNDFVAISAGTYHNLAIKQVPPIEAEIKLAPETVNLASKGGWIMGIIRLPEGDNVADIDANSILLEDEIQAERVWLTDEFAVVKFSRKAVQEVLGEVETPSQLELVVSGELSDESIFEGADVVRVIDKGRKKQIGAGVKIRRGR
ncbi:MAG: hypothetical protein JSW23_00060 [Planctomycetota bacterium]|nr:MAG: hypothetical protein JSW23_00060 [Planctomycetota bacterium]